MESCHGFLHVVQKGDTLYLLSKRYCVPLWMILCANPYVNIYNLQVGDEICIPRKVQPREGMPVDK
ncbi:MAG: LysM peptidoglycan-binding domain-containing protein [Lachnospiraceae bacterium]|jgi:LysM repeat protein|nr:LysM peptidoglycan-binding domain-containing protein [Lachnospiraceae bacterium]